MTVDCVSEGRTLTAAVRGELDHHRAKEVMTELDEQLVIRLTSALRTPSSLFTAFSTWAEHAEQVIPVTSNFCFKGNTSFQRRAPPMGAPAPRRRSGANSERSKCDTPPWGGVSSA